MTIGGAEMFFGMRYCTYIWSTMIWPGGADPVGGESGNAVAAACPLTKKTPSSWSSSGPPSEPAAAVVIRPAVRPAANKLMLMVQWFGFALMMKSSQELRSRNFAQDRAQGCDGRQLRCRTHQAVLNSTRRQLRVRRSFSDRAQPARWGMLGGIENRDYQRGAADDCGREWESPPQTAPGIARPVLAPMMCADFAGGWTP